MKNIKEIVEKNGIEYKKGMRADKAGNMITMPAPDGQPRHYDKKTNTGGRRFVCWIT